MRTIKFRGKRLDNKAWVFGSYSDFIMAGENEPQPCIIYTHPDKIGNMIIAVDPKTISQFTGLLDRNGKEIYEGDILGCPEDNYFLHEAVIFAEGCFIVKDDYTTTPMCAIDTQYRTVIGSIHDHPDLLNGK